MLVKSVAGARMLLDAGARMMDQDENQMTAVHYAARAGRAPVLELLLQCLPDGVTPAQAVMRTDHEFRT